MITHELQSRVMVLAPLGEEDIDKDMAVHKTHTVFRLLQERDVEKVAAASKRHARNSTAGRPGAGSSEARDSEHVMQDSTQCNLGNLLKCSDGPSASVGKSAEDKVSLRRRPQMYIDKFSDFELSVGGPFYLPIPDHLLVNEAERPKFEAMCSVLLVNALHMRRLCKIRGKA